jgi:hypothetical protein
MVGREEHNYSQIRVPVLALVGFPKTPEEQMKETTSLMKASALLSKRFMGCMWV